MAVMPERIGVYICECGPNIKEATDINELMKVVESMENVVLVKRYNLLCSEEGKEFLKKDIKEHRLSRVVIAACSAKEHEATFKKILEDAGLNPFLLQIANIREQCAWVIKDKVLATEKAKTIIKAAVNRVAYHEALEIKEIEASPDVLVLGAGIAGISAALSLAQKNRKVYLVDKSPCIGGKVARYEEVFPKLECASCMLDPKLDEVLHHERIEVLTLGQIQEVLGSYGNFTVKVKKQARYVDNSCIGCGVCFEACPVKVKNEYNEGLDERHAVYIPYAGALPFLAVIDKNNCLHFQGQDCVACQKTCPFGSIHYEESDQVLELKVGAIVLATGFDLFDCAKAGQYGYGKIENVYTSLEFERILSPTGPTSGKILLKNGKPPKRIAFIHCVGSRTKAFNQHCSGICCTYLLKFAHLARKQIHDISLSMVYSDLCLPGKDAQAFADKVKENKEIVLFRMNAPNAIEVAPGKEDIRIKYRDSNEKLSEFTADMVVLAPAIEGSTDSKALADFFDIARDKGGFFIESHAKLAPVSTAIEGIFIAGCAQGPREIADSVAQAQAAGGLVLSRLIPGEKLKLEPMVSVVDEDFCSGCKTCIALCPYKAITYDAKKKKTVINEVLCKGCGVCAAACPSGAIKARHFTDKQILKELNGLLK
jgi:heterodisulfide reductase subunit A2